MPKKITIVSGIALILLAAIVAVLVSVSGRRTYSVPNKVSVYIPESSEILTMEYGEFLEGCLRGMLGESDFETEALTAAAAAMNSRAMYALATKSGFANFGADFTVGAELPYISAEITDEHFAEAVREGKKLLLTYNGEPINAQMCMISAGRTDDQSPISPSVSLPCDIGINGFESRAAYTPDEVRVALHRSGVLTGDCRMWFHDAVYADNGTLLYISFNEDKVTGAALKKALGLRSTAISVEYAEDKFYFTCLGLGENKGMSVNAADFLARSGKSAEEILGTFYPGAEINVIK